MTQLREPGQSALHQVSEPGQRPSYPLSKAAQMTGTSPSTMKRKRAAGAFPNAVQDEHGMWLVSVGDLLAAGYHLNQSQPDTNTNTTQVSNQGQRSVTHGSELGQAQVWAERISSLERQLQQAIADRLIEQTRREAAEQIAAEREKRAATAERALLMLEGMTYRPTSPAEPATAGTEAPQLVVETSAPAVAKPKPSLWRRLRGN